MDRDEANLRKALDGCVRSRDWSAFRVGLLALRDRLAELGREGEPLNLPVTRFRHKMTGAFLKHPDPAAWEAAADLLLATCGKRSCNCALAELFDEDETCETLAARWRLRAVMFPRVMEQYRKSVDTGSGQLMTGALLLSFRRRERTVVVCASPSGPQRLGSRRIWLIKPKSTLYHTAHAIDLIDEHAEFIGRGA